MFFPRFMMTHQVDLYMDKREGEHQVKHLVVMSIIPM